MSHTTASLEYRGRRIISQCTRVCGPTEPYFGVMSLDIEGLSWVEDAAGLRLTPDVECRYSTYVSGSDGDNAEKCHKGWLLLGDFIFLTDHRRLSLWVEGPPKEGQESLLATTLDVSGVSTLTTSASMSTSEFPLSGDSDVRLAAALARSSLLCTVSDFLNFYGDAVSAVRFMDAEGDLTPEGIERRAARVTCGTVGPCTGPLDAIGGAARVFMDGYGWRWLFPHESGPAAALSLLRSTSTADDLARLRSLLDTATAWERNLAEAHFRVASRGIAPDSMHHCTRGLDVANAMRLPVMLPEVAATIEQVFAKAPTESLNLKITAIRRKQDGTATGANDIWEEQEVGLAEALAGNEPGKEGYRVIVGNKATTTLEGIGAIPHLGYLDASDLEHLEDLGDLARCTSLRRIRLSIWGKEDRLKDIAAMSGLRDLEDLDLTGRNALSDLATVGSLHALQRLVIRDCVGIRSVEPLRSLNLLQELDLQGSMVESLEPLQDLPLLSKLMPVSYALTSLRGAPTTWLKTLKNLHLNGACGLKDFSALSGADGLESLSVEFGDDSSPARGIAVANEDLGSLALIPALTTLELRTATPVTRLDALTGMAIESLQFGVGGGALEDLAAVGSLTRLKDLRLTVAAGVSLKSLATLTQLEKLEVEGDIESLAGIENCTALKELWLRKTPRVTDLSPISRMARLEKLYIESSDGIASLVPLAACVGLRSLRIANQHRVVDLSPLAGLVCLEDLHLGSSPFVCSLRPLAGLSRLKDFSFGHMPALQSLEGIPTNWLSIVEELNVDLPSLEHMAELCHAVNLRRIFIFSLGACSLAPLGELRKLECVHVYSAPRVSTLEGLLPGEGIRDVTLNIGNMRELRSIEALAQLPCLGTVKTSGMQSHPDAPSLAGQGPLLAKLGDRWERQEF